MLLSFNHTIVIPSEPLENFEPGSGLQPWDLPVNNTVVSHQWYDLFYRLLYSSTRHIEKVEGGERDTQLVHMNEATAV
jgi:hypothetical protein